MNKSQLSLFLLAVLTTRTALGFDVLDTKTEEWFYETKNQISDYFSDFQIPSFDEIEEKVEGYVHNFDNVLGKEHPLLTNKTTFFDDACSYGEICTITNVEITVDSDLEWKPDNEGLTQIIFTNAQFTCQKDSGKYCEFAMIFNTNMRQITFQQGSFIRGDAVAIEAPTANLDILDTSSLDSTGTSQLNQGTKDGHGGSNVANGGFCDQEDPEEDIDFDFTYNDFDDSPHLYRPGTTQGHGSQGINNNNQTNGGSKVMVMVDSINIPNSGALQANGYPLESDWVSGQVMGGSGGAVFLTTYNRFQQNTIGTDAAIQAMGGYGKGGGFGGSGGMIYLNGTFPKPTTNNYGADSSPDNLAYFNAQGGKSTYTYGFTKNCQNGGAGTVYWALDEMVYVDNYDTQSSQRTMIAPNKEDWLPDTVALNTGNVQVNKHGKQMTINQLYLGEDSTLNVDKSIYRLDLNISNNLYLDKNSHLNFHNIGKTVTIDSQTNVKDMTLGHLTFDENLQILGYNVNILGNITDQEENKDKTVVQVQANETVTLQNQGYIRSQYLLLDAKVVDIQAGSQIVSDGENTCNSLKTDGDYLFSCIPTDYNERTFDQAYVLDYYQNETNKRHELFEDLMDTWSVYILGWEKVTINSAYIEGPRIGVCAPNMDIQSSDLSADGRGCLADKGTGKGVQKHKCAGTGAANGGDGGYGGISGNDWDEKDAEKCEIAAPNNFETQVLVEKFGPAHYEGAGGGSAPHTDSGGSGGGIVWLSASNNINLHNSEISAKGAAGERLDPEDLGSGGGAGGSIQIITNSLEGEGTISVAGGHGSYGGGGGGAGGRFVMAFLSYYKWSQANWQMYGWTGDLYQGGGQSGPVDDGSFPGQDGFDGVHASQPCQAGFSGPLCAPCPIGTFKYDFSYGICQQCKNKPHHSYYNEAGSDSAQCSYQCNDGRTHVHNNPECLSAEELEVERVGGGFSAVGILAIFLLLTLILWGVMIHKHAQMEEIIVQINESLFDEMWKEPSKYNTMVNEASFEIKDFNIWSHVHRMYLIGQNSINFPWIIPKDFPVDALEREDRNKLINFIQTKQSSYAWQPHQKTRFTVLKFLFPAFARDFHARLRKEHFSQLQNVLFWHFQDKFWAQESDNKTMRLGCSKQDHQLAYIDFLDFSNTKQNHKGFKVPLTILMSGSGTFNNPWFIDYEEDPLAKSLVLIHKDFMKQKLPLFYENLNSKLSKLSFFHFTRITMQDISDIVEWVDVGNKLMFNPFNIKATLYILENSYQEVEEGVYRQKRRSFPLETVVFEAFPDFLKKVIQFVKDKQLNNKSEVRLALVFRKHNQNTQRNLERRITNYLRNAKHNDSVQQFIGQNQENLIFGEDVYDYEEVPLNQQQNLDNSDLGASVFEQRSDILGNQENQPFSVNNKFISRSTRSFSISLDSSKSFEVAIRRPRSKSENCYNTIAGALYSLWLLLFKPHGTPTQSNIYLKFFLYSLFVALDLILLFSMLGHCIWPKTYAKLVWIPFLLTYPGMVLISPYYAVKGIFKGSPLMMKKHAEVNEHVVLANYSLTLVYMVLAHDQHWWIFQVLMLMLNKIFMSWTGADIRQNMINPNYEENQKKLATIFELKESQRLDDNQGLVDFGLVGEDQIKNIESGKSLNAHSEIQEEVLDQQQKTNYLLQSNQNTHSDEGMGDSQMLQQNQDQEDGILDQ